MKYGVRVTEYGVRITVRGVSCKIDIIQHLKMRHRDLKHTKSGIMCCALLPEAYGMTILTDTDGCIGPTITRMSCKVELK